MRVRTVVSRIGFVLFAGSLIAGLYYAGQAGAQIQCRDIEVLIDDSAKLSFVTRERILHHLQEHFPLLYGRPIEEINTSELENSLQTLSGIDDVQVYYGVDGNLRVRVVQREPLFRIVSQGGSSRYVDRAGYVFPVDDHYTAHVLLVTGNIGLPDGKRLVEVHGEPRGLLPEQESVLACRDEHWNRLYEFLHFLLSDPLWSSQFSQVYIDSWRRIELIPRVGAQIVVLGTLENFVYKLNKLYSVYRSLLKEKVLEEYVTIDLQYSNQVICQRKQ